MEEKFVKFDFTEQDILDSFDLFMENANHRKHRYYFDEIIDEFLQYMKPDIISAYGKENLYKCTNYMKNRLYKNEEKLYIKYGENEH